MINIYLPGLMQQKCNTNEYSTTYPINFIFVQTTKTKWDQENFIKKKKIQPKINPKEN